MIHIKTPCDANWQKMDAVDVGKYCSSCEKVVVDFSKMNDDEIKNYFNIHRSQKTCGRFLNSQLNQSLAIPKKKSHTTRTHFFSHITFVQSVVFFMASSVLWLSSCIKKQTTLGEPKVGDDSCNTHIMGDIGMVEDTVTQSSPEDTIPYIQGEVDQHQEMIMGKVYMPNTNTQKIKRRK